MQTSFRKTELLGIGIGAIIVLGLLPALNAFTPESSIFHISNFTINLYGKYLCYAVLAISVDLLWGYTGLLSLGQCLFFAVGGYAFGMHLMLLIGKLGQYHSDLPDFMVFLGYPALPLQWGAVPQFLVRGGRRCSRARPFGPGLRLSGISFPDPRRLLFDSDPGADLRCLSDVFPQ